MSAAIARYEAFRGLKSLQFSVLALFLYDYLLTLPREVDVIWPDMFRVSTVIYFTTRYLPVVNIAYAIVRSPVTHCGWDMQFVLSLVIVSRIGVNMTLIARAYAICTRHRLIVALVGLIGLSEIVFDSLLVPCYQPYSCFEFHAGPGYATAITRLCFEAAVTVLTVVQIAKNFSLRNAFNARTLAGFIMTHGIIYFIAAFILEAMCIGVVNTQIRPEYFLPGASGSFPTPLVAILISRFHLDLRSISGHITEKSTERGMLSTVHFIGRRVQTAFTDDLRDFGASESGSSTRGGTISETFSLKESFRSNPSSNMELGRGQSTQTVVSSQTPPRLKPADHNDTQEDGTSLTT